MSDAPADLTLTDHAAAGVRLIEQAHEFGVPDHVAAVELALLGDTPTYDPGDPVAAVDQTPGPAPEWLLDDDLELEQAEAGEEVAERG